MQPAEGERKRPCRTLGPGYPAPMRLLLRGRYLARMALVMAGTMALGVVSMLYFWPLARAPAGTPYGGMLVVFLVGAGFVAIVAGLYYFTFGAVWAARGQTGIILNAEGYTDSTMLTELTSVRVLWGNVRSIVIDSIEGASSAAYVRVDLTDDSVYQSYSFLKRLMTHTMYKKRRRYYLFGPMRQGIQLGLLGSRDVILVRGLPVSAECLASLMNSYLLAWLREHHHGERQPAQVAGNLPAPESARTLADNMENERTDK